MALIALTAVGRNEEYGDLYWLICFKIQYDQMTECDIAGFRLEHNLCFRLVGLSDLIYYADLDEDCESSTFKLLVYEYSNWLH